MQSLGFKANVQKSYLKSRQQVLFIGLCLNSLTMKASLTPQRAIKIQGDEDSEQVQATRTSTARDEASPRHTEQGAQTRPERELELYHY